MAFANDIICWGSLIVISNRFLRTSQQLRHDYEHGASRKLVVHMSLPMLR